MLRSLVSCALIASLVACAPTLAPYQATMSSLPAVSKPKPTSTPQLMVFLSPVSQDTLDQVITWNSSSFALAQRDKFNQYLIDLLLLKLSDQGILAGASLKGKETLAEATKRSGARFGLLVQVSTLSAGGWLERRSASGGGNGGNNLNGALLQEPALLLILIPIFIIALIVVAVRQKDIVHEEFNVALDVHLFDSETNREVYHKSFRETSSEEKEYPFGEGKQPDFQGWLIEGILPKLSRELASKTKKEMATSKSQPAQPLAPNSASQPTSFAAPQEFVPFMP